MANLIYRPRRAFVPGAAFGSLGGTEGQSPVEQSMDFQDRQSRLDATRRRAMQQDALAAQAQARSEQMQLLAEQNKTADRRATQARRFALTQDYLNQPGEHTREGLGAVLSTLEPDAPDDAATTFARRRAAQQARQQEIARTLEQSRVNNRAVDARKQAQLAEGGAKPRFEVVASDRHIAPGQEGMSEREAAAANARRDALQQQRVAAEGAYQQSFSPLTADQRAMVLKDYPTTDATGRPISPAWTPNMPGAPQPGQSPGPMAAQVSKLQADLLGTQPGSAEEASVVAQIEALSARPGSYAPPQAAANPYASLSNEQLMAESGRMLPPAPAAVASPAPEGPPPAAAPIIVNRNLTPAELAAARSEPVQGWPTANVPTASPVPQAPAGAVPAIPGSPPPVAQGPMPPQAFVPPGISVPASVGMTNEQFQAKLGNEIAATQQGIEADRAAGRAPWQAPGAGGALATGPLPARAMSPLEQAKLDDTKENTLLKRTARTTMEINGPAPTPIDASLAQAASQRAPWPRTGAFRNFNDAASAMTQLADYVAADTSLNSRNPQVARLAASSFEADPKYRSAVELVQADQRKDPAGVYDAMNALTGMSSFSPGTMWQYWTDMSGAARSLRASINAAKRIAAAVESAKARGTQAAPLPPATTSAEPAPWAGVPGIPGTLPAPR